ncbi:phage tail protein [Novosphingobium sp. 9]|uniref:phage tail protein n=1 Tax=Novosphingobium sp. 9 TaxID=2025349 RepID=UPI0021B5F665|nr:phage tail protein [Novosphingobium sp. 9]
MADATTSLTGASPAQLLTLGLFVFGMDTIAYSDFQRRMSWRHERSDRFKARASSQFTGPGEDAVSIAGLIVPEVAGNYGAITTLIEMADTGGNWPLLDGFGTVLGHFEIDRIDQTHRTVLAGGIPRAIDFVLELTRID